jgi:FAD/FMN-containing dehydrogenase
VAGNAVNDGGLVIDLSQMRGVHVDPSTRTVRAQGGALWGDCDRETQLFGLAVPGGVVSTTGIAGLTLHGGVGHVRRKHGLSIDNLLSVDIVTADGKLRRASATENEDLFWAVRGAGSNFGVVTSFEFRAHPVGPLVMVGAIFYPQDVGGTVLPAWRDYMASAPDELSALAFFWNVPEHEPFPPEHHGKPVLILAAVYSGSVEDGEPVVQPLRELAQPLVDLSGPWSWLGLQSGFDASRRGSFATGSRAPSQSCLTRRLTRSPTGRPAGRRRLRTSRSGTTAAQSAGSTRRRRPTPVATPPSS